jgi:uridylate kinase
MDEYTSPLWIRQPFLTHKEKFEDDLIVIFGHTIGHPGFYTNKIAIDSGCFYTGVLTAVEIIEDKMRFIYVYGPDPTNPERQGKLIPPGQGPISYFQGY